jgi:hypothetical protein
LDEGALGDGDGVPSLDRKRLDFFSVTHVSSTTREEW